MPRDVEVQQRLAISRVPINKQDPKERRMNWDEVFLGFDLESAKVEAMRCLQCPTAPCQDACPVSNDIPGAFKLLENGDVFGAAEKFRETSNLPELCGRLCPQERLCEGECVVAFAIRPDSHQEPPVSIGKLEAFVTDYQRKNGGVPLPVLPPPTGYKVAAGLAAKLGPIGGRFEGSMSSYTWKFRNDNTPSPPPAPGATDKIYWISFVLGYQY